MTVPQPFFIDVVLHKYPEYKINMNDDTTISNDPDGIITLI